MTVISRAAVRENKHYKDSDGCTTESVRLLSLSTRNINRNRTDLIVTVTWALKSRTSRLKNGFYPTAMTALNAIKNNPDTSPVHSNGSCNYNGSFFLIVFMTVASVCVACVFIVAVLMLLLCTDSPSPFHFVVCVSQRQ